jgi:hypothetical protein
MLLSEFICAYGTKYKNNFTAAEACISNYSLQVFVFFPPSFSFPPTSGIKQTLCIDRFQFRPSWGGWRQLLRFK